MRLDRVRAVADAVMYEGYLLYPYRRSSSKNHSRWQFGVLGPAAAAGFGEEPSMGVELLLDQVGPAAALNVQLRFLQLQRRQLYRGAEPVDELVLAGETLLSWDEAVPREIELSVHVAEPFAVTPVAVAGGEETAPLTEQERIVRRRWPITVTLGATCTSSGATTTVALRVHNTTTGAGNREEAVQRSLLGAHLIVVAHDCSFVSLLDPPAEHAAAAAQCRQDRCWPVLAGDPGDRDLVLASPIILYDYPEVAAESPGALFDATEIDEILSLRVLTLTEGEKAEARASDPLARAIVDRIDAMGPAELARLHGTLRDPPGTPGSHAAPGETPVRSDSEPWWDPASDASVDPARDGVEISGRRVARGSRVVVHPRRSADAQDMFYEGEVATVAAVLHDVDAATHLAVVLANDPAADLHEWYGRYLYFAPDEVEPLDP